MTEANPNPSDAPKGPESDPDLNVEIERTLAEACDLADRLEEQIGTIDLTAETLADLRVEDAPPPEDEIESDTDPVDGVPNAADADRADAQSVEAVPEHPSDVQNADGSDPFVNTPDNRSDPPEPNDDRDASARSELPANSGTTSRRAQVGRRARSALRRIDVVGRFRAVGPPARVAAHRLTCAALHACDAIDGVFAFVTYDVRRLLGWVALALFVAACAISAWSWSS